MSHAEVHVFLATEYGLHRVSPEQWSAFENGEQPIDAAETDQVKLLLLTIRDGICELVEPLCVNVDAHGFVDRREHALRPLTAATSVVDGRERFINRYLNHAHQWRLERATLEDAFRQSGITASAGQNTTGLGDVSPHR